MIDIQVSKADTKNDGSTWITVTNRINSTECYVSTNAQLFPPLNSRPLEISVKGNEHPKFKTSEVQTVSYIKPWDYLGLFVSVISVQ